METPGPERVLLEHYFDELKLSAEPNKGESGAKYKSDKVKYGKERRKRP